MGKWFFSWSSYWQQYYFILAVLLHFSGPFVISLLSNIYFSFKCSINVYLYYCLHHCVCVFTKLDLSFLFSLSVLMVKVIQIVFLKELWYFKVFHSWQKMNFKLKCSLMSTDNAIKTFLMMGRSQGNWWETNKGSYESQILFLYRIIRMWIKRHRLSWAKYSIISSSDKLIFVLQVHSYLFPHCL